MTLLVIFWVVHAHPNNQKTTNKQDWQGCVKEISRATRVHRGGILYGTKSSQKTYTNGYKKNYKTERKMENRHQAQTYPAKSKIQLTICSPINAQTNKTNEGKT